MPPRRVLDMIATWEKGTWEQRCHVTLEDGSSVCVWLPLNRSLSGRCRLCCCRKLGFCIALDAVLCVCVCVCPCPDSGLNPGAWGRGRN